MLWWIERTFGPEYVDGQVFYVSLLNTWYLYGEPHNLCFMDTPNLTGIDVLHI